MGSNINISGIGIYQTVEGETIEISLNDCIIEGMDTASAGPKELVVQYEETVVRIPYGVAEYNIYLDANGGISTQTEVSLYNYEFDSTLVEVPIKLGKEFVGWYRDMAGTIPFGRAEEGEITLTLYAAYRDYRNIICDDNGYIIGYSGDPDTVIDTVLNIPRKENVKGIGSDPFQNISEVVTEVFIPKNIEYIAPTAFDSLLYLFYVEVERGNPVYYSKEGIVYHKETNEVVIFPNGQRDIQ